LEIEETLVKKVFTLAWTIILLSACATPRAIAPPTTSAPTSAPVVSPPLTAPSAPATSTASAAATIPANARALTLTTLDDARTLPDKILGASVESLIEHVLDDPRKVAAIKATAPAVIRFPGGSQSNYYDWRDGLLHFDAKPNSSSYYKMWAGIAPLIAQAHAKGVHYEEYAAFANQIGDADIVIVPNLETSSVEEQAAWFKKLASENLAPKNIELGNEFWIAMAGDPNVMRKWPDEKSSMAVMQQYTAALRPIVGADAKFAVQASAASFMQLPNPDQAFARRLAQWDADLAPADWFQAVTAHLYSDPTGVVTQARNPSPQQFFALMMARSDQGVDRALDDLTKKLPGKEIWVTEWNPRGGSPVNLDRPDLDQVPPPMNAQLIARTELALLRHPEVTRALYFTLYSSGRSVLEVYVQSGNQFVPMAPAVVVGWFDDAANGGATFQCVVEVNGPIIGDLGSFKESYRPIEGGLFRSSAHTVLILQNASAETRVYDPTQGNMPKPSSVELLVTADLMNTAHVPAQVTRLDKNAPIVLPPLSIARVIWERVP
jgi:hypothetical protein